MIPLMPLQNPTKTRQHTTLRAERRRLQQRPKDAGRKQTLYDIIFEADTPAGRWFDIALLIAILGSITIVSLETIPSYQQRAGILSFFYGTEWVLTILFTIEYVLRLSCVRRPLRYAFSFWGVIDLLSILPSYVTIFVGPSSRSFVILRSVRLLRVFRVLKLWRMMDEADELGLAIWRARNKIIVFLVVVLVAVTISGTLMYHIESIQSGEHASQFTSIPQAMYWAIVTMTTVGYGDVVPQTAVGKVISAILILLGYSLIIVPSTFVTAQFAQRHQEPKELPCPDCDADGQRGDATFCYRCGAKLAGS
jgi:voltage-gated potassium channel